MTTQAMSDMSSVLEKMLQAHRDLMLLRNAAMKEAATNREAGIDAPEQDMMTLMLIRASTHLTNATADMPEQAWHGIKATGLALSPMDVMTCLEGIPGVLNASRN